MTAAGAMLRCVTSPGNQILLSGWTQSTVGPHRSTHQCYKLDLPRELRAVWSKIER